MELLGFLQHFASWQALFLIATIDVCVILVHLGSPSRGVPSLASLLPFPREDPHMQELGRLHEERARLSEEMLRRLSEMRNVTKTLKAPAEVVNSLDDKLRRLEESLQRLRTDWEDSTAGTNL